MSQLAKLLTISLTCQIQALWAQTMPTSAVETYRAESHKGLEEPVLNLRFPHTDKLEISLGGAFSPYSTLMEYGALNAGLVWHLDRQHAIEPINFAYHMGWLSDFTKSEVAAKVPGTPVSVEIPKTSFIASYFYTPFYSKMSVTPRSTLHFSAYFGGGFGITKSTEVFADDSTGTEFTRPTGSLAAGLRFLMPSRWGLRAELRDLIRQSQDFNTEETGHNLQVMLMLSIFFGSFPDVKTL